MPGSRHEMVLRPDVSESHDQNKDAAKFPQRPLIIGDKWDFLAGGAGSGVSDRLPSHVELDLARNFDDCFGVMAVLEQRVFDGLRAVDEQAAIKTVLFLGDPVATAVLANKDDGRLRAARWRFDELHVSIPFEWRALRATDFPSLRS